MHNTISVVVLKKKQNLFAKNPSNLHETAETRSAAYATIITRYHSFTHPHNTHNTRTSHTCIITVHYTSDTAAGGRIRYRQVMVVAPVPRRTAGRPVRRIVRTWCNLYPSGAGKHKRVVREYSNRVQKYLYYHRPIHLFNVYNIYVHVHVH